MSEKEAAKDEWPSWVWWAGGIFALLAYCNYSERDQRRAPPNATVGMTAGQISEYEGCLRRSSYADLSDYTKSEMCRRSALGLDSEVNCKTEWDGRANPDVCE
jgi:hypothetical protein